MGWVSHCLHKTLDVKKLSCAKDCTNVLSLLTASSVKPVTNFPSLRTLPLPDPEVSHTS